MPLNIGDSDSSRSLLSWEKYQDQQLKIERDTRIDQDAMQWLITITEDITYCIKFSGNFHKKHLYTSTKKPANVQAEYNLLTLISDDNERWLAAQEAADEKKFSRQLAHRARIEQDCACGHSVKEHPASGACTKVTTVIGPTGATKNGKPARGPIATPCPCVKYEPAYAEKRGTLQGKPSVNPLVGATAISNDAIWLDKIPRSHFEKTIVAAIQKCAKELSDAKKTWNVGGEHVKWDFGALCQGCVLKIALGKSLAASKAENFSAVDVLMTLDNEDAKRPIYTACHLDGKHTS